MTKEYEIFEDEVGHFYVMGPHGLVGGVFVSEENAAKYADDLNSGKTTEAIESLVDESGIRMWLTSYDLRERALKHKRKLLAVALVLFVLLVFAASSWQTNKVNSKLDASRKEVASLQDDSDFLNEQLEKSNKDISACHADVELAWRAYKRRNDLFVKVLRDVDVNTEEIKIDNSLLYSEFLSTQECSNVSYEDVFGE